MIDLNNWWNQVRIRSNSIPFFLFRKSRGETGFSSILIGFIETYLFSSVCITSGSTWCNWGLHPPLVNKFWDDSGFSIFGLNASEWYVLKLLKWVLALILRQSRLSIFRSRSKKYADIQTAQVQISRIFKVYILNRGKIRMLTCR